MLQRVLGVREGKVAGRVGRHSYKNTKKPPGRRGLVDFATDFSEPLVITLEGNSERGFSSSFEKDKHDFQLSF